MPIVCISAASINEEWQKYRKAGMNAFLQKPFTEEMLLTTIIAVSWMNNIKFAMQIPVDENNCQTGWCRKN